MKRRVFLLGILLAVLGLISIVSQNTNADNGGKFSRHKTVEINVTQYVWELISNRDGRLICEIVVEYPTRPTYQDTITFCAEQIFTSELTPTPSDVSQATPAPFDLAEFFQTVSYRFMKTQKLIRAVEVPVAEMTVNLVSPGAPAGQPFVSIYAYEPVIGEKILEIRGNLNGWEFYCPSTRCDVPITKDAILEFWAVSSYGDESLHSRATIRLLRTEQGDQIELTSLEPVVLYQDACAAIWRLPQYQRPKWADLPPLPDDLNTMKPYQYLAGQLLNAGIVSAQDCPGGGLISPGAPNLCGLNQAMDAVIDWQNQFDMVIWDTARKLGIPPRIMKTLIEQESQFWPANGRRYIFEYGLGQLSQAGADVALRWDNELFASVCNGLLYDCSIVYGKLPTWVQAQLRGGLMNMMNSECATCAHGIDLTRAQDSIPVLARILRSNCQQVKYIVDRNGSTASYEDLWRMTLVSYHSGYECLNSALVVLKYNDLDADWDNLSSVLSCPSGRLYTNEFWKSLLEFDMYQVKRPERGQLVARAEFVATPTPTITPKPTMTPTVMLSMAHIRVLVFIDHNHNQYPDDAERVNEVTVEAQFQDGSTKTVQTTRGEAIFDLSGRPVGGYVVISLPELYRTQRMRINQDGEVPVIFRLEEPIVPPVLP